jgi:cytochrome c553
MVAIAGRSPDELTATMEAFRSGARPATLMNRLVRGFTPDEVRAISRWLSEQRS